MVKVRASVFFILFLVACSSLALAFTDIEVTAVKNQITAKEEALFDLEITNQADERQRYSIYSFQSGQGWNVDPSPLKDKIIELDPGQSKTVRMAVRALDRMTAGIYYMYVTVESDLGETYREALKVYFSSNEPRGYLPAFRVTVDMNEKIDPRQTVPIKLFLENRNPLNLTNLQVRIQSDIPEFTEEALVDLPPLGKKTLEFSIVPNRYQAPQQHTLFFVFSRDDEVLKVEEKKIEILPQDLPFIVEVQRQDAFLKTLSVATVRNEGNVRSTQQVTVPASWWEALFTGSVDSQVIAEQRFLVWEVTLDPNSSTPLPYETNYRWILYLLIALLLFAAFYWYVQSPVTITKTAVTAKGEEGSLSEIKVTLEVKNLSSKPLRDVLITDSVPGIANIEKGLELGTLKPKEVIQTRNGPRVIWALAELDGHEQRLITYKVKAKLNIVGTFSLPRASVDFKKKRGGGGKAYSNVFKISA